MNIKSEPSLGAWGNLKANRYLVILFLASTLILLLPLAFNSFPTVQESVKKIEIEARNKGSEAVDGGRLCDAMEDGGEINIRVFGSLTDLFDYQNLFQTSNLNAGIRFEIDRLGQGALLIGSSATDGFSSLSISQKFAVDNFDVAILIKDGSNVSVSFFNTVNEKVFTGLKPLCDQIIVGSGYDSSRAVKGEVKFIATASFSKPRFIPNWLDDGVRVDWFRALVTAVFLFSALLIAFKMSLDVDDEKKCEDKKQDCV